MKIIYLLLATICLATNAMERPPKAARVLPEPQERISVPANPSYDDGSSTPTGSKRKGQAPMQALKKPRAQESFSIAYYLKNNLQAILSRIKGNILDLSHMNISSLDGLLSIPGIRNIAHIVLAHNVIKQVKRGDFAGLGHLITLDLSSNLLEFLLTDSFAELESLSNLFLNNNIIRAIQHDSFAGLNNLKQLSLSHNRLQEISSEMFTGVGNLEQLDLSDNQINIIEPYTFVRLTFLKKLKLKGNQLSLVTDAMFNAPKREGFVDIRIEKSKSFQLRNLEELDLRNNKLITIPTSVLPRTPALQRLLLANNQIAQITDSNISALKRLTNLKILDISNNQLSEATVKKITAAFPGVNIIATVAMEPTLEIEQLVKMSQEKKLREQQQEESASEILSQMPKQAKRKEAPSARPPQTIISLRTYLNDRSFSFGARRYKSNENERWYELDHLDLDSLDGLLEIPFIQNTVRIYLDHNKLKAIPRRSFEGLIQLRDIILSSNNIATLDPESFAGVPNLKSVYLDNNHISVLRPELMQQFKNIQILNLDENQISSWPPLIFKDLNKLTELSVGHNDLKQLQPEMLVGLDNLERLDIPANQFTHLDPSLFTPLKKLTFLNLIDNPLSKENVKAIERTLPQVTVAF